ncbi:hypothetical protein ACFL3T_04020 [Patescibacteria group bacterium]
MSDKELFELCQQYGREARLARNKFVALLPEVYRRGLYRKKGFGSIFEFAAKLGGVGKNVVEEVIRVDRKLEEMPKLKAKISEVGLSKVRVVANVVTKETDNKWAKKVSMMTKSALSTHVKDSRPGARNLIEPDVPIYVNEYQDHTMKLDPKTIQRLKHLKANMKPGTTWNDVINYLLDNKKLKKQRARNLKAKAKTTCEYEGCTKPATEIHHQDPWAKSRGHKNLKSYCKPHHELAHQSESTIDSKYRAFKFQIC